MTDPKFEGFPELSPIDDFEPTRPLPIQELPRQVRIDHEMAIIRTYHERIAKSIEIFWGHRDCIEYLQKLILSGGDGIGLVVSARNPSWKRFATRTWFCNRCSDYRRSLAGA